MSRLARTINLFKHYPVLEVIFKPGPGTQMERFFKGDYDVAIAPLTPFPRTISTSVDPFEDMFGTGTFTMHNDDGTPMIQDQLLLHAKMYKWFREGTGNTYIHTQLPTHTLTHTIGKTLMKDVALPHDKDGNQLPHGATTWICFAF